MQHQHSCKDSIYIILCTASAQLQRAASSQLQGQHLYCVHLYYVQHQHSCCRDPAAIANSTVAGAATASAQLQRQHRHSYKGSYISTTAAAIHQHPRISSRNTNTSISSLIADRHETLVCFTHRRITRFPRIFRCCPAMGRHNHKHIQAYIRFHAGIVYTRMHTHAPPTPSLVIYI